MSMTKFDIDRSIAILNTAKQGGMYPDPLPDSDGDKIQEASRIVELANQAKSIADAVAEQYRAAQEAQGNEPTREDLIKAREEKVPHYSAVMDVLVQAEVLGGTEPDRYPESASPPPSPTVEEASAAQMSAETGYSLSDKEIVAARYREGSKWVDENGTIWVIVEAGEDSAEVHEDGKAEKMIVPFGFLKKEVAVAPESTEESPPSAASSQSPSEPSGEQPPTPPPSPPSPESQSSSSSSGDSDPSPPASSGSSSDSQSDSPSTPPLDRASDIPVDDDEGDEEYRKIIDRSEAIFARAKLPLPTDVYDPPELPEDLTQVDDVTARKLHSQFNACAARAHYLQGIEKRKRIDCQRIKKARMKGAMRTAREQLGKDASVTEVTNLAEEDPTVEPWIRREERHLDREEAYQTLYQIYTENVSVLSRDWTMRDTDEKGS